MLHVKSSWRILMAVIVLFILTDTHAQEYLSGLEGNPVLLNRSTDKPIKSEATLDTLSLPFFDDFSKNSVYPLSSLWIDNETFVFYEHDMNPITVGVALFDALNEKGKVYSHASSSAFLADHLTSHPIDMKTSVSIADSVYLSFYFQPGGGMGQPWQLKGNAPEREDSLVLEFSVYPPDSTYIYDTSYVFIDSIHGTDTTYITLDSIRIVADSVYTPINLLVFVADTLINQVWQRVWASAGMTLEEMNDTYNILFRQIMVPLKNEKFFYKGFQFRFMNYASLYDNEQLGWKSGNIDQWHLDYVYLNKGRSQTDITYEDVAFTRAQHNMLKKYTAIPWAHFNTTSASGLVKDSLTMYHRYLGVQPAVSPNFNFEIDDLSGTTPDFSLFGAIGQSINSSATEAPFYNLCSYDFKSNNPANPDSVVFKLTGIMKNSLPFSHANDTIIFYQKFFNYYAYDDGIPDNGYGIKGDKAAAACRFTSLKKDTLKAVQIYMNPTLNNENAQPIKLCVWADSDGFPGVELYSQDILKPQFEDSLNQYYTYLITNKDLLLSDSYFIGWIQEKDMYMNIGFDKSINRQAEVFYKTGSEWYNTMYNGTLMIRPVFGKDIPLSIDEEANADKQNKYVLYPNPAREEIILNSEFLIFNLNEEVDVSIKSMLGQNMFNSKFKIQNLELGIDVRQFTPGIYLMQITEEDGSVSNHKFIIAR